MDALVIVIVAIVVIVAIAFISISNKLNRAIVKIDEADAGIDVRALKVDGGACANNYLMQTQSDISNAPVLRPACVETTAMGAAYLAGLAVGYWKSPEEIRRNWSVDRSFDPRISSEERAQRITGWKKAVSRAYDWAKDE